MFMDDDARRPLRQRPLSARHWNGNRGGVTRAEPGLGIELLGKWGGHLDQRAVDALMGCGPRIAEEVLRELEGQAHMVRNPSVFVRRACNCKRMADAIQLADPASMSAPVTPREPLAATPDAQQISVRAHSNLPPASEPISLRAHFSEPPASEPISLRAHFSEPPASEILTEAAEAAQAPPRPSRPQLKSMTTQEFRQERHEQVSAALSEEEAVAKEARAHACTLRVELDAARSEAASLIEERARAEASERHLAELLRNEVVALQEEARCAHEGLQEHAALAGQAAAAEALAAEQAKAEAAHVQRARDVAERAEEAAASEAATVQEAHKMSRKSMVMLETYGTELAESSQLHRQTEFHRATLERRAKEAEVNQNVHEARSKHLEQSIESLRAEMEERLSNERAAALQNENKYVERMRANEERLERKHSEHFVLHEQLLERKHAESLRNSEKALERMHSEHVQAHGDLIVRQQSQHFEAREATLKRMHSEHFETQMGLLERKHAEHVLAQEDILERRHEELLKAEQKALELKHAEVMELGMTADEAAGLAANTEAQVGRMKEELEVHREHLEIERRAHEEARAELEARDFDVTLSVAPGQTVDGGVYGVTYGRPAPDFGGFGAKFAGPAERLRSSGCCRRRRPEGHRHAQPTQGPDDAHVYGSRAF